MKDELKNGFGVVKYPNGDKYEGDFMNDEFHGKGKYITMEMTYEGEWYRGYCHGFGKEMWEDGSFFQGYFQNGVKHGNGTYLWGDGSSYEGEWRDGKMEGRGKFAPGGRGTLCFGRPLVGKRDLCIPS